MSSRRCCACEGKTLDRLLQPTVMALLVDGPQHGYALVDRLKDSPLMKDTKPDDTGVYRLLNTLEEQGLVSHCVAESKLGPSKRMYELTDFGKGCLSKWVATLDDYQRAIRRLVTMMRKAEAKISHKDRTKQTKKSV
jgi:DNA-binding PadR family transcriptional regulator